MLKTNDRQLTDLMKSIEDGSIQLPEFQRGWVWDDNRIKALILSVIRSFPVGAAMFLDYGNGAYHFKPRVIEGSESDKQSAIPSELILDGQQRLTSLYNALYSRKPVKTQNDSKNEVEVYYYLDIEKALDPSADDNDIVISVPASKVVTADFGRATTLDLTTTQNEYNCKMFPLNIILDPVNEQNWQNGYYAYHHYDESVIKQFTTFYSAIIMPTQTYTIPIILLGKETPKEAVCQVFENVNTGGVSLTVFELVTATFAADDFQLRDDWEKRKEQYFSNSILADVTSTDFLTGLTLLATYKSGGTVSCKRRDVLSLQCATYKEYADLMCKGFAAAEKLLQEERIFTSRDLPYSTQLIPLAAICSVLTESDLLHTATVRNKVKQWYWCGVFGELYGSANESRYANDITQVVHWIVHNGELPKTITDFFFNPMRLIGLQTRQSAAYKGIMALILKTHARDFISGTEIDFSTFVDDNIDIHHVFPKSYCIKQSYDKSIWNSVINKTPLSAKSNRIIGGSAPSQYLKSLEKKGSVSSSDLDNFVDSHLIDHSLLRNNDFSNFIVDRARKLLSAIEDATGRTISGKDSAEVLSTFGTTLSIAQDSDPDSTQEDNTSGDSFTANSIPLYLNITVSGNPIAARGYKLGDSFMVLHGSQIAHYDESTALESFSRSLISQRKSAAITPEGILQVDLSFRTPSTAAEFVTGKSQNGRKCWKDADGKTLKELENLGIL